MATNTTESRDSAPIDAHSTALAKVRDALNGLRFGEITVIVQDGLVVQVERTEKVRIARR